MQGLPQKHKIALESLRKLADHARNYHEYRSRLRNTAPPAVRYPLSSFCTLAHARTRPCPRPRPPVPASPPCHTFDSHYSLSRCMPNLRIVSHRRLRLPTFAFHPTIPPSLRTTSQGTLGCVEPSLSYYYVGAVICARARLPSSSVRPASRSPSPSSPHLLPCCRAHRLLRFIPLSLISPSLVSPAL